MMTHTPASLCLNEYGIAGRSTQLLADMQALTTLDGSSKPAPTAPTLNNYICISSTLNQGSANSLLKVPVHFWYSDYFYAIDFTIKSLNMITYRKP